MTIEATGLSKMATFADNPRDSKTSLLSSEAVRFVRVLSKKSAPEDVLIAAMVAVPKLIERPVVLANGKATLGRPPESVLDIL